MPKVQEVMDALQQMRAFENRTFELVVAKYLSSAITAEPLEKTRLVCESAMMAKELSDKYASILTILHKAALALKTPNPSDPFIAVPWPFPPTEQSFIMYIAPWLETFPYPQWGNEVTREKQKQELEGKPDWEQFFLITTKLNLSPVALWQMRHEFYCYAMPSLMLITADLTGRLSPSSLLSVLNPQPREKEGGWKQ